jgi:indolepyruvate ferredoxin oxidoreductase
MNTQAFRLGRLAAAKPAQFADMLKGHDEATKHKSLGEMSLDEIIAHRSVHLTAYQDAALADRYRALVDKVRRAADAKGFADALPRAVAVSYAKLLAYKDEYEVARLYTDGSFEKQLRDQFEGNFKLSYHLAPPLLPAADDGAGRPRKKAFGRWMRTGFKLLAQLKGLRGTPFDLFGYSKDRKLERALIAEFEGDVDTVLKALAPETELTAIALMPIADDIRGYGIVKEQAYRKTRAKRDALLKELANPPPQVARQIAAE